jgi:Leucine-rich repeat (LRR) protein
MKRLLFIFILLSAALTGISQDWRYLKGKKLFTSLDDALSHPSEVYNLSLSGSDLYHRDFSGIKNMIHLHYLSLNEAGLEYLPVDLFDKLTELRTLSMTGNKFTRLPDQIRNLRKLEYLVMYDNAIDSIPDWIGGLELLDNLILPRNRIHYLSPAISNLKRLKYLSLGGNELKTIPGDIGLLSALEYLDFSSNKLTAIPSSIAHLGRLITLGLSDNPIRILPEKMDGLLSLQNLQLSRTSIMKLPASVGRLNRLKELYLDHNPQLDLSGLSALPDSLETLHISKTKPGNIPDCIRNCGMLENLEAEENQYKELPEWFKELGNLQWILLDENKLTFLPEWVCAFKKLTILRVSNNPIDTIPPCLFSLPELEGVSFYGTTIRHLPRTIFGAKKLKWFNVVNTKLTYEECYQVKKKIPVSTNFMYDSPFYFDDETVPCYTEKVEFKKWDGYAQHVVDPYFKGGNEKFQLLLNSQLDTSIFSKVRPLKGDQWTDSVVVKFYVQRRGGLFNLQFDGHPDALLMQETKRLMLLTCRFWVPPMTGGFFISGRTQLVFVFSSVLKENEHIRSVHAHNPLPATPKILRLVED